jgi:hypothetical protein
MNNQPELEIDEDGTKWWYLNDKLHKEDGGAVIYADGDKYWYLNGEQYFTEEEWFNLLTPEQQYNYLWSLDEV